MDTKCWALDYVARLGGNVAAEDAIKEAAIIEGYLAGIISVEVEVLPPRKDENGPPRKPDDFRAVLRMGKNAGEAQ